MARPLRQDKDARARTQAKPYKAVESGGENEPLTMEFRTALLRSRQASPDLRVRGALPLRVRPLLLSFALLFAAASGAQAQVVIDSVTWNYAVGDSTLDVTAVNTSIGTNTALLAAVCFNNNELQLPLSVTLDPGGASQTSLDWLDVGNQGCQY